MDIFRTVIFLMHLLTACVLTFGVFLRCSQKPFSYELIADTHVCKAGSNCTAPYVESVASFNASCYAQAEVSAECSLQGLPLYDKSSPTVGWHLFSILAHFEWVSAAFAYFYIRSKYQPYSWVISICITFVGTLLCMPWTADIFWNEVILFWATFVGCAGIFYTFHDVVPDSVQGKGRLAAETAALLFPKLTHESKRDLSHEYARVPTRLAGDSDRGCGAPPVTYTEEPALRMLEYSFTGSELFIAVLNLFIPNAPAFFTLLGYGLVFVTNICGVLVHYGMIMMNDKSAVEKPAAELALKPLVNNVTARMKTFDVTYLQQADPKNAGPAARWYAKVGLAGFWSPEPNGPPGDGSEDVCRLGWGSPRSITLSALIHAWLAYVVALTLVFYQGNLLYSKSAPGFVVASGWLLILMYSSFGFWATAAWYWPSILRWRIMGTCFGCSDRHETDVDAVFTRGLDVLSLSAKLSIVYNLSFGFIFMGGGVC